DRAVNLDGAEHRHVHRVRAGQPQQEEAHEEEHPRPEGQVLQGHGSDSHLLWGSPLLGGLGVFSLRLCAKAFRAKAPREDAKTAKEFDRATLTYCFAAMTVAPAARPMSPYTLVSASRTSTTSAPANGVARTAASA